MPGDRSSRPSSGRLTSFHIAASSFAALAGVALAAYQVLAPSGTAQQPVNVTVALEPQADAGTADMVVAKSDSEAEITMATVELDRGATFTAALKDGAEQRYDFARLFDGLPDTYLVIAEPDTELNVLVTFGQAQAQDVTAISYSPPANAKPGRLASTVDVIVLPEGQMEATGRPVYSFSLQSSPGSQTFAIPGRAQGKGMWLRVSGPEGATDVAVGDFRIIREQIAQ